ncbi:MAG: hypothetical protein IPM98_13010 [Lewinellaceae bacterium]|nr:hypothetical protein [Lewinellaceae bacterium]
MFDKLEFLQRLPELTANRGVGFNYTATRPDGSPDVWDTANVSGYEKRVAALLGIPDCRRRTLGTIFDVHAYREVIDKTGSGNNQTGRFRLWNRPVGRPGAGNTAATQRCRPPDCQWQAG